MDLQEAAERLYAAAAEQFMAVRKELVATAKQSPTPATAKELAKEIGALRKPTVPAWALNQLARARPEDLAALLDLGERLRRAQARGAGDDLRELGRERGRLVAAATRSAGEVAADLGTVLSAAAEREVQETLTAALASPAAAEAVASGTLTRALSYAGFGEVDVADASAVRLTLVRGGRASEPTAAHQDGPETEPARSAGRSAEDKRRRSAAARLTTAEDEARTAGERLAEATEVLDAATTALIAAQSQVEDLEGQLESAREELLRLTTRRAQAARAHRDAQQAARAAVIELDAAQAHT